MALTSDTKQVRYNDPFDISGDGAVKSDIDKGTNSRQIHTEYWWKKALVELPKETYFSAFAGTINMPKHFGKKIVRSEYLPILDDRNVNDQGIDASGSAIANGNLYGSSKDITKITSKIPLGNETGGRYHRVGTSRIVHEGQIYKVGFFLDFTRDALDFDSDDQLYGHFSSEMIKTANEIQEDLLQTDLLNAAGTIRYSGAATSLATMTGEGSTISEVTYDDLQALDKDLTAMRTPMKTKVITGSQKTNTRVIEACRFMFVGSDVIQTLERMKDYHDNPAFIPAAHYAYAGGLDKINTINGEVGKIGRFRIIQVPEMQLHEGKGATATGANAGYQITSAKYNVYPMLVIGDDAFTTIGFKTDGRDTKFRMRHFMPGEAGASFNINDPYGENGLISIKFWYGFLAYRKERIGLLWTVARM